jgi:hypothetical protein
MQQKQVQTNIEKNLRKSIQIVFMLNRIKITSATM